MRRTADVNSFSIRHIARWAMLAWLFIAPCLHAQELLLITSQSTQPYLHTINQLREVLDSDQLTLLSRPASAVTNNHIKQAEFIITLGVDALEQVLSRGDSPPVLAAMIPKQSFEALVAHFNATDRISQQKLTAIYLEQPYSRQLQLARLLMPAAQRVGALLGPTSHVQRPLLEKAALQQGFETQLVSLNEQDNPLSVIRNLVEQSDLLITLPDNPDFTRNTAKWLLMLSLRQRIPLIGFSRRYVEAGALASVFSSPTSISGEVAQWTNLWLNNPLHKLPPPSYPERFELSLNPSIATRLGISIPAEDQLRSRLLLDSSP